MTVIVTADLHWNDNPRDLYRHHFVEWLTVCLKKHKPEALFILGDLTDAKDEHKAWLVNQVVLHITQLALFCPVIILRGNHDFLSPDWPFFRFVSKLDNVYWINWAEEDNGPTLTDLKPKLTIGRFVMLPHTSDYKKDWTNFDFSRYDWAFTHNTFEGSNYGQGPLAKGISPDVLPDTCLVLSGDVHIPQRVPPNVVYVGAPYRIDFGDEYEPHVALVTKNKLAYIEVPGVQKRLVEIRSLADLKKVNLDGGDLVKVRVNLATEERSQWPAMQAEIREWAEKQGVTLISSQPMVEREPGQTRRSPRLYDDKQLVRAYVKNCGADAATEKTGLRLTEKA